MSRDQVEQFLRWVVQDDAFAAQVGSDPSLMNGYDLTPAEREAILRGDADLLREEGVPEELLAALDDVAGPGGPGTSTLT